jgi:hypothetical protein
MGGAEWGNKLPRRTESSWCLLWTQGGSRRAVRGVESHADDDGSLMASPVSKMKRTLGRGEDEAVGRVAVGANRRVAVAPAWRR